MAFGLKATRTIQYDTSCELLMTEDTAVPNKAGHLPEFESLRGIAILLVFCFHYLGKLYGHGASEGMPTALALLFCGDVGVTLFFVLSGFLLSRPFLQGAPLNLGAYFMRRALRILPMFYLVVLLAALWSGQWLQALGVMLFQGIRVGVMAPMGNVWWSLAVEVQFYLLLPAIVWLLRRPGWRHVCWGLIPLATYAYYQVCVSGLEQGFWADQRDSLVGRWPLFAVGAVLAWVQLRFGAVLCHVAKYRWLGLVLAVVALLALNLLAEYRVHQFGSLAHGLFYEHYLLDALAWAVFIFALLNFKFPGAGVFVNPLLHRLGLWSYSFYLLHSSVLFFLLRDNSFVQLPLRPVGWAEELLFGVGILLLAVALSACTYRYIELPFLRMKPLSWGRATGLKRATPANSSGL